MIAGAFFGSMMAGFGSGVVNRKFLERKPLEIEVTFDFTVEGKPTSAVKITNFV